MEPHYYEVNVEWKHDRLGIFSSPEIDNKINCSDEGVEVATPPEFPKGIDKIWSPEHLYTAAVAGCLMTTFLAIADNSRLEFSGFHCQAKGKLEQVDGKFLMSEVYLRPTITINDEKDRDKALRIADKSEKACLISNSIKSTIIFEPIIEINA